MDPIPLPDTFITLFFSVFVMTVLRVVLSYPYYKLFDTRISYLAITEVVPTDVCRSYGIAFHRETVEF